MGIVVSRLGGRVTPSVVQSLDALRRGRMNWSTAGTVRVRSAPVGSASSVRSTAYGGERSSFPA